MLLVQYIVIWKCFLQNIFKGVAHQYHVATQPEVYNLLALEKSALALVGQGGIITIKVLRESNTVY